MFGYDQQRHAAAAASNYNYQGFDAAQQQAVNDYMRAMTGHTANPLAAAAGYGQALDSYGNGNYNRGFSASAAPSSNSVPIGSAGGYSGYSFNYGRPSNTFGVSNASQNKRIVGRAAWTKRPKAPKPVVDPSQFYCELCSITCGGSQSFQDHLTGKSHKRKEEQHKAGQKTGRNVFRCEVCNVTCTGKDSYDTHMSGTKHNRALTTLKKLGKTIPENSGPSEPLGDPLENLPVTKKVVGVSATKFVGGLNLKTTEKDNDDDIGDENEESAPSVGEEFIEQIPGAKHVQYNCKLCDCVCGDPAARALHIKGRRHRLQYKLKVDSSIKVDMKPNTRVKGIKPGLLNSRGPANATALQAYPLHNGPLISVVPDTSIYDAYDEQHVHARLEQIRPEHEHVKAIEALVEVVEKTLKKVSDKFSEEAKDESDNDRLLRGVIRVGPLGEHLLLKTDESVDAVLLCRDIPSLTLLQRIVNEFEELSKEASEVKVNVELAYDDSAFVVSLEGQAFKCVVTLSSVLLRKQDSEEPKVEALEVPTDALPSEPCLKALANLRHTKFFQSKCIDIPSLVEVVLLLRDISSRVETWSVLPLYVMELLAYRTIVSHPVPLRVCDAFRRFFEVMATGQFLSSRAALEDPCEKEDVNPLGHLTKQQRENVICSAQHGLRLIAYDQIHIIMGMERVKVTRKRALEDSEENDSKRVKTDAEVPGAESASATADADSAPAPPAPEEQNPTNN